MSVPRGEEQGSKGAPAEPARPGADPAAGTEAATADEAATESQAADEAGDAQSVAADGGTPTAPPAEAAADAAAAEEAATSDPLAQLSAERDEYLALAQRAQADFENYRKRSARELAAAGARGKAALAREILPAVDNLERALASVDEAEASLAEGVRLVLAELVAALERNGVASIEPEGEEFDPTLHEALSTRAENGTPAGVVLDVVQKGYRLDETVLRPARVVVAA